MRHLQQSCCGCPSNAFAINGDDLRRSGFAA
jgi:hypothetical protein